MNKRMSQLLRAWSQLCLASCLFAGSVAAGSAHAQSADPNAEPPPEEAVSMAPPAAPSAGTAPAIPGADPRTQALLMERERLLSQRIGIGAPLSMLGAGLALTAIGWGPLYAAADYCTSDGYGRSCAWNPRMTAGTIVGVSGLALTAAGAAFLTVSVIRRARRRHELNRIDSDLRLLNMRASVAPWFGVAHGSPVGLSGKVTF